MKKKLAVLTVAATISLFLAQAATAAEVTVNSFTTAYGLFDLGDSSYDPATHTTTILLDVSAFVAEFPSTTPTPFLDRKFDTISFELLAAPNERITKVSYSERLQTIVTHDTDGFSYTASTGSAVVNSVSNGLGAFYQLTPTTGTFFELKTSYNIPGMENEVDVSITNDILAFAFGDNAYAKVQKQYAMMEVKSAAVPIPATLWLLGSAIAGLAATRRKGQEV
ncbi:MAG: VPLPA-CTERM sorting domain-containing protein [Proteobacteria bacterium]|nr:VPLPA-CTERM sorting domain-containing protein [Pseudomonadota bacterium]MBU4297154.1 VPLPA-CTERM sorting domain-containing protein [Pseudomonadota bacterium]MCG2749428.1 VPLPA-CTERM sorting domain-containing protein [Desulfobulbaceae bacterium]